MEPLLDSATGAPRRLPEDLHPPAAEDSEGPEVGDASMLSSHTSAATESTAHESSVASSYRFPAHEGMFTSDYAPFSLQGLQQKHSEEMATAGKDQSCDVKRNDSHGTEGFGPGCAMQLVTWMQCWNDRFSDAVLLLIAGESAVPMLINSTTNANLASKPSTALLLLHNSCNTEGRAGT